jgi:hypothetical protein
VHYAAQQGKDRLLRRHKVKSSHFVIDAGQLPFRFIPLRAESEPKKSLGK